MKKLLAVIAAVSMTAALAGCGSSASTQTASTQAVSEAASAVSTEAVSTAAAETAASTEASSEAATKAPATEGKVMTHDEDMAAETESPVTVETYVQAKQSWWENKATFYTQAEDGAYFIYDCPCSEEDYDKLTPGTKIKVTGYKSEWSGEIEITDATFEIEDGNYVAKPADLTSELGSEDLIDHQNEFAAFKGMTVEASKDASGKDAAFLYNYDGSGAEGDDLYFNVSVNGKTYTFTVESYLCDKDTDVYKAVENLKVGDKVDMEGFLYWYEGVNPHITSITVE